ncbi:TRAP transporter small permease [Aneurinibacillus sp. BA2021]|nr:TRAP transporter small permease [Aneurinibacillus sp. BA2021]
MKVLKKWLEIVTGLSLAVVVLATFAQVLLRFVFKIPAPWTEEVSRIAFAYMVFLGSALGVKYKAHLSVDILSAFPVPARKPIASLGHVLAIIFVAIFTYYGWVHATNSWEQFTPTLEISLFYLYLILPVSGVLMLYYLCKNMIEELKSTEEVKSA